MSSTLVTLDEVKAYLELPSTFTAHDALLLDLAGRVQRLLERTKNRTFAPAETITVSVNGTGQRWLWLERPVGTLTSVKLGKDIANPETTLTPGPTTVIAQGRRLYRQDDGIFPLGVANVHVTYTAATSLDEDAKQAVLEGEALAYRSRGSEDATSESFGSFSHALRKDFHELPSWKAIPRRPVLV